MRTQKVWVQVENGSKCFSVPPISPILQIQEKCRTGMVVQPSCLSGTSFDSLTVGWMEVGINADGSAMVLMTVNSDFSVGLNSDRLVMGRIEAGISSDRIAGAPTEKTKIII